MVLFILNSHFYIYLYKSLSSFPLKGNFPNNITYKRIPRDHISADLPKYSVFLTISGAIYDGVPQKILSFLSDDTLTENPKSIILIIIVSLSIKMFSNQLLTIQLTHQGIIIHHIIQ